MEFKRNVLLTAGVIAMGLLLGTSAAAQQLPVADAGGPYSGTIGEEVFFDGSGSTNPDDPNGNLLSTFEWTFGDDTTGSGETVRHTYDEPDTYTVTLTLTNKDGGVDWDEATATIEPVPSNVSKVAAEGEALPVDDVLTVILRLGGVAINDLGKVAFGGRSVLSDSTDAAFTQDGLVVKEGDTLGDGTILDRFSDKGKVAINNLGIVAFHGRDDANTDAVFTQDGLVVKEGDTLPDGTLVDRISDLGGVAINDLGLVAFHGRIVVGDAGTDTVRAVFTQDGVVVKEGDTLGDGTIVAEINDLGGVAINELGQVAFHGRTIVGGTSIEAVFTQDRLVVKEGDTLGDDITIVDEIDPAGGVAINLFDEVAFHGLSVTNFAVFTQHGPVVQVGDTLGDGTIVDQIHETGGVAINFFGQVAFHGQADNTAIDAVFTQDGRVAKEGDLLPDATTLGEISEDAGVAINFSGHVAFHARIGEIPARTDAVFVAEAIFPGDTE